MGVTLAKIAANTATIHVPIGDDVVNITYYPGRITEHTMAACQIDGSTTDEVMSSFDGYNETLCSIIKSWDIYEDDEQTKLLPVDVEHFAALPLAFRGAIYQTIMVDIRPNALVSSMTLSSAPSDAGSSSMA
jgi:hypothetical protein